MGYARDQFEAHHEAARLDAPPAGALENYARYVLNDLEIGTAQLLAEQAPGDFGEAAEFVIKEHIVPGIGVVEAGVSVADYKYARHQMEAAANALLESAGRPRPSRPSRTPRYAPAPKAAPTPTSTSDRTASIRARYGRSPK